jgi:GNAT superfamily N-acetyltransferase
MRIDIRLAESRSEIEQFIRFPWKIYAGLPNWVPPLLSEMRAKLDTRKNPFFTYGRIQLFTAHDDHGSVLGRLAAIHNPRCRSCRKEQPGFFGLFECMDMPHVAGALFDAASRFLKDLSCTRLVGPVNFTTNDEVGVLIDGFENRPMIMCAYSPPYYGNLLESCGFTKCMDVFSYGARRDHPFLPRFDRVLQRISYNPAITARPFSTRDAVRDIATIQQIYNISLSTVPGFVPLLPEEAQAIGSGFLSFLDEQLIWLAEYDGRPVGFILAIPDVNEILHDLNGRLLPFGILQFYWKRRRLRNVRVVALAVLPEARSLGIETLLIQKIRDRFAAAGYVAAEFSVVNEANTSMRNLLQKCGFNITQRYRLFVRPITPVEVLST